MWLSVTTPLLALVMAGGQSAGRLTEPGGADEQEHPGRQAWQKPTRVVAALNIRAGQVVADVGCGSGYFIPYLSRAVGASGRVYAVEVQQEMLDYVERKVERLRLRNVTALLSQETSTGLPAGSVDVALLVDVYAELGAPRALLADLHAVLKSGGRLAVVDFRPDKRAADVGPPLSHRIAERRVKAELEAAGFRPVERHGFLPYQYFLVFGKAAEHQPAGRGER